MYYLFSTFDGHKPKGMLRLFITNANSGTAISGRYDVVSYFLRVGA